MRLMLVLNPMRFKKRPARKIGKKPMMPVRLDKPTPGKYRPWGS